MESKLSTFDSTLERFATVTGDQQIRVWDTDGTLLQTLSETSHLATRYTAIAWGPVPSESQAKRGKQQSTSSIAWGVLAVGNTKGGVVLWDVASGKEQARFGENNEGHDSRVTSLVFNDEGNILFSASADKHIVQWNVDNGKVIAKFLADKQPIQQIRLSPDNNMLAVGSSHIRVWDLASRSKVLKLTGHTKAIVGMSFSGDGKYIVSSAGDRVVNMWNTQEKQEAQVFTSTYNPYFLECNHKRKTGLDLLSVCGNGTVNVWTYSAEEKDKKRKAKTIEAATSIKIKDKKIIRATFSGKNEITVAVLNDVGIQFETVAYRDAETDEISESKIIIRTEDIKGKENKQGKDKKRGQVKIYDVAGTADIKLPSSKVGGTQASKLVQMNGDSSTMEERLKRLEGFIDEPQDNKQIVAESLGKVLEQALNSGDGQLLESVLQAGTPSVAANTVQHLPSVFIVPLIKIIVRKVQMAPGRAHQMMVWITAVIERHAAFIITVPAAAESLQSFYTLLETRVTTFSSFLALNGRLGLLINHAEKRRTRKATGTIATVADLPLVTESDSEDDDEDDEDDDEVGEDIDGAFDSDEEAMMEEEDEEENGAVGGSDEDSDGETGVAGGDDDSDDDAMEEEEEEN